MLPLQRKAKIFEMIREDGSAKVSELSQIFKVTEVTIRQDLEKLESEGLIGREHGGAFLRQISEHATDLTLVNQENLDKKAKIARHCLEFIEDGDIIILDSGSTTTEIAKALAANRAPTSTNIRLTVITNALNIAMILGSLPGIEVMMTGGEFKPPTLSLTGQKAADFFHGLHAHKLFLATAGISLKAGLTYPSISDLTVKKAMIETAEATYVVADSTKFGTSALASLGALSLVDYIVTDKGINDRQKRMLQENEIKLILAP